VPTYSYECTKCKAVTDVFHGMSASPKVKCSACGGRTHRLMGTGSGLIFKGSGFYETDFKDKKGTPDKAPESKSEGGKPAKEGTAAKKDGGSSKESAKPASKPEKTASAKAAS